MKSALTLIAALTLATPALGSQAPDYVKIRSLAYAGSGCPAGTVAENVSSDGQALTLLFDSFIAESAPGVSIRESRKNCQLNIDLDFPQGWTFAVLKADYRGYVSLERNTTAIQQSTYYFQGNRHQCTFSTQFRGPVDKDYVVSDTVLLPDLVWSPCGQKRSLNINTSVRTDNRRNKYASALATVDSIDGSVEQIYNLYWKRCPR